MRFSHRHSVFLCIFYHVYQGFVGWGGVGWDDNGHVTRDAQRTACDVDVMFVHADISTQCYVDGWGGVGWDDNGHVTRDAQRTACDVDVMFVHADIGTQCYVDGWGVVGWGRMITFMLRVMHNALRCWCNVRARWHRYAVLRWWVGWGGVGWGGVG